ncbi:MAG: NAD-dependent dihydropyrimidine dehydrogenase subunit PreA [Myxococcota bacterium]|nr:NAD-dependent dihydropyrimidine dehydrogenase subunit PreA [Myxococcota bacterium]
MDISIDVDGVHFDNPFVLGSGPPGTNARVIKKAYDAGWGGVVAKTTALSDTSVINVTPRYEKLKTTTGQVIGFQNIELISDRPFEDWEKDFRELKAEYPRKALIASIMESYEKERWQELASRCETAGVDALELNFSCPHGHPERGMGAAMGQDPQRVQTVTSWVTEVANIPVWAKMTPNITDIRKPALAAKTGGAQGISAINTILGVIGVNLKTLKPLPTVEGHSVPGGYSYLGTKPIGLRMVQELARDISGISISGMGGVTASNDAIEYILLGASTVQVCTGAMLQGLKMVDELKDGLGKFLQTHGFNSLSDAVGHSLQYFTTHHDLVAKQSERRREKQRSRSSSDLQWGELSLEQTTSQMTSTEAS